MKNQEGYENSSDFLEITENGNSKNPKQIGFFLNNLLSIPTSNIVNGLYLACAIVFEPVGVNLNKRILECDYSYT